MTFNSSLVPKKINIFLSLFIIIGLSSSSNSATVEFGCGYTSDGVYRCSDSAPRMSPSSKASNNETSDYISKVVATPIREAKLVSYSYEVKSDTTIKGLFSVEISYCLSSPNHSADWKKKKDGVYLLQNNNDPSSYTWILGGAPSTIKEIPMSLSYTLSLRKGVAMAQPCYPENKVVHLFCEILPNFYGAGCQFLINNEQYLYLELFRNYPEHGSVLLYKK